MLVTPPVRRGAGGPPHFQNSPAAEAVPGIPCRPPVRAVPAASRRERSLHPALAAPAPGRRPPLLPPPAAAIRSAPANSRSTPAPPHNPPSRERSTPPLAALRW